jgi:group II intron reverse transcriptase/maturase
MQNAATILSIHQDRGQRGLPLDRVYRQLFNSELYLRAYGKIYRNAGATTKGATGETVDGMSLEKIQQIIDLLRQEKYHWTPVRRVEIPKPKGGTRPLGIPSWCDKLLQEVLRELLEAYYEPRFSDHSHGFRPKRGCHTALSEVQKTWKGTIWFIEGDISKCFDSFDHELMLEILRKDIHDGRLIRLIEHLLKAGYMEDWQFHETLSGTPQGGIISPLLSNIYLNELDGFVENTLVPAYTKGEGRQKSPEYASINNRIFRERKKGNGETVARLLKLRRTLPSCDPFDNDYRRLRFVRYADDFLLGFAGPKKEAEEIRERLGGFLGQKLKLNLSLTKTLITHATDEKAKFLGYELTTTRDNNLLSKDGGRRTNGYICLRMPDSVAKNIDTKHRRNGKVVHWPALLQDSDYTILQRYQAVFRGIYNYYCMATNVSDQMGKIKWTLEGSLVKTLARKFQISVRQVYKKYQKVNLDGLKQLQVVIERPGKDPLIAVFGGFRLIRVPNPPYLSDFNVRRTWMHFRNNRSEVVQRLMAGKCELCGKEGSVAVHHIRKLADIDRPGRRPKTPAEKVMAARRRKTLVVCEDCHQSIHGGEYDGPSFRG